MGSGEVILPTGKNEVTRENPRVMVIYGPPKIGKTTLLSLLPNNLILDLEEGTEYVETISMNIIGWAPPVGEKTTVRDARYVNLEYYMLEAGASIMKGGKPYDFISVDTVTVLEEMVIPFAGEMYKASPMGANYDGSDVRTLPRGAGYYYLREAFKEAVNKIKKLADNIILVGHLKDTFADKKGKEVMVKDLDLTGKIRMLTCAGADAIGYMHRGPDSEVLVNFKSSDDVLCGSRCPHLRGKEIKLAEWDAEKEELINVSWELIYPSLKK